MPPSLNQQMHDAVLTGNIPKVTQLLNGGFNVNTIIAGHSPITYAVMRKNNNIFLFLLERGADVSIDTLKWAVIKDMRDAITKIRQKGISANSVISERPLLTFAQSIAAATALLVPVEGSAKADLNATYVVGGDTRSMMDHYVGNYDHMPEKTALDIAEFLMKQGADPMPKSNLQYTILHAISDPDRNISNDKAFAIIDYVKENHKPLLNVEYKRYFYSSTPLGFACENKRNAIAEKFMKIPEVNINKGLPAPIYDCELSVFNKLLNRRDLDLSIECKKNFTDEDDPKVHIVNGFLDKVTNYDYDSDIPQTAVVFRKLLQRLAAEGKQQYMVEPFHDNDDYLPLEIAAEQDYPDLFKALLDLGAPTVKITDRMWENYEDGEYSDEIRAMFPARPAPPPPAAKPLWKGITQSDASMWRTIFDFEAPPGQKPPAYKYSFCPTCFKVTMAPEERKDGCLFVKHNCLDEARLYGGYVHMELWEKYKSKNPYNDRYYMEWCSVCGRVSKDHHHYPITYHAAPKPEPIKPSGGDYYTESHCKLYLGGGGWEEKVKRVRRMREMVKELLPQVGTITMEDAKKMIIEAMWDAPLFPMPAKEANIIAKKNFTNFPNTEFLRNVRPAAAAPAAFVAPNVLRSEANRANPALQPRLIENGVNAVGAADDVPVIQFRHRRQNGDINNHEDQFIGVDTFLGFIQNQVKMFGTDAFPRCYMWPECDAYLYPDEIQPFVPPELYEEYKRKFNEHFAPKNAPVAAAGAGAGMAGGAADGTADDEPLFMFAEEAECAVEPRRGGRRTLKKRNGVRKTRRRYIRK